MRRTFATLLIQHLRIEFSDRERFFSPLMFAATMLLLFWFAFGELTNREPVIFFVAETFLVAFLALQVSLARAFESETEDDAFELLRTYPIAPAAWFLAKYVGVLITSLVITVPTVLLARLLMTSPADLLTPGLALILLLVLAGLGALGVILAAMTLRASAARILFPILYFPLTCPVLLAAVNSSLLLLNGEQTIASLLDSWLGLLLAFDVVYVTLGLLLFGELLTQD